MTLIYNLKFSNDIKLAFKNRCYLCSFEKLVMILFYHPHVEVYEFFWVVRIIVTHLGGLKIYPFSRIDATPTPPRGTQFGHLQKLYGAGVGALRNILIFSFRYCYSQGNRHKSSNVHVNTTLSNKSETRIQLIQIHVSYINFLYFLNRGRVGVKEISSNVGEGRLLKGSITQAHAVSRNCILNVMKQ